MMVLASCQDVAEETAQSEAVAAESGYPSLHTVPPRPQLSYTVEQRRAIVDGLIADRENARYSSGVVRYRTGLSSLPPPEAPVVAVAPLEAAPEPSDAADASLPPGAVPDRPVADPETEFLYEDDDLDSFMEEMVGDRTEPPGGIAPAPGGPASNAAPLGSNVVRASAGSPVGSSAANDGRAPGAVWAIPMATASLPDESTPAARATPATGTRQAASAPGPVATAPAGRAPGVVWGMPDTAAKPAAPTSNGTARRAADTSAAPRSGKPVLAAPIGTTGGTEQRGDPVETATAGRAPGVVWAMPAAMVDEAAEPISAATGTRAVDTSAASRPAPPSAPRKPAPAAPFEAIDGSEERVEPIETALADRPLPRPLLKPGAGVATIDVAHGLIAIDVAASDAHDRALGSVAFGPGSATLPPDATARLEQFLAEAKGPEARIRIVGEADAPALALDRARAVGLALVQSGVPADRLELTLARDAAGDQARLFLAAPAP